jgi:ureidoglycolate hydrolase
MVVNIILKYGWVEIDENLLLITEFTGIGYKPMIDFGTWRVAVLRYIDELIPDRIEQLERHNQTDEVFVLLAGRAVLFIGDGDVEPTGLTSQVMEPGKLYNVIQKTWHTVVLSLDASILLVENRDTDTDNSDYVFLSAPLRQIIIETSAREIPDCWGK